MSAKGKLFFLISAGVAVIFISLFINTQLNKNTDTFKEEIQAQGQGQSVNQAIPSTAMAGQVVLAGKEAITVIGAAPVEQRMKAEAVVAIPEIKREARVIQTQNSASSGIKQEDINVTPLSSGILIQKEPTNEEKKKMSSKSTIIF